MPGGKQAPVAEDGAFERATYRVQIVGWVVMLLVAAAACAGLFGGGPLAKAHAGGAPGQPAVAYDRILRHRAPRPFELTVPPDEIHGNSLRIWMDHDLADALDVQRMTPSPHAQSTTADRWQLDFHVEPGRPAHIRFQVEPDGMLGHSGVIGMNDGPPVPIRLFVLP